MKKFGISLACLTLVLGLFVANAHAVGVGPMPDPYSSSVEAWTDYDYDSDTSSAHAQDDDSDAWAVASGWDLGGRSLTSFSGEPGSSRGADTYSTITQDFMVSAAGAASITFGWDGYLNISGANVGSSYSAGYSLTAYDGLSVNGDIHADDQRYSLGYTPVTGSDSFTYSFSGDQVGDIFSITYELYTFTDVDYYGFSGSSYITLDSSFMQGGTPTSFAITGIEGGIMALGGPQVPLPGAFLLLGSGLLGLIGFGRKRRTQ